MIPSQSLYPKRLQNKKPQSPLQTDDQSAEAISGEHYAEHYLGRRLACSHCPVACIHIAALREPYQDEAYYYKTTMISYDYEPIYALGSMLGLKRELPPPSVSFGVPKLTRTPEPVACMLLYRPEAVLK